jgi:hypothetical protein
MVGFAVRPIRPRACEAVLQVLREAVVELHHEVVEEAAEHTRAKSVAATKKHPAPAPVTPRGGGRHGKARRT